MNTHSKKYAFPLAVTALLFACGSNQGQAVPGTALTPASGPPSQARADMAVVDRLASARCDQEEVCKNIGEGAKFATRNVCMEQIHGSIANDLNSYDCPRGLDSSAVDRCMAAIKNEECSHPFDTLRRYEKCRTGAICMN